MSTVKNVGAYGFSLFDEGQKIPFCPLLTHLGVALQKSLFFQQKPNLADMIFYDFFSSTCNGNTILSLQKCDISWTFQWDLEVITNSTTWFLWVFELEL